jgi:hypothetical protein
MRKLLVILNAILRDRKPWHNHHAAVIYSLDETLLKAGRFLDRPVSLGIRSRRSQRP